MALHNVCIEVRRNLRCANVFLQFAAQHRLDNNDDDKNLKINVEGNAICLAETTGVVKRIDLSNYFDIVQAHIMCNLHVEPHNASLRLIIKNIRMPALASILGKQIPVTPSPALHSTAALHCSKCKAQLMTRRQFTRILAYPTGSIDTSEFFCHHGPTDIEKKLLPGPQDIFYGFNYMLVNARAMHTTINVVATLVYCIACEQLLGETVPSGEAFKLWAESVRVQHGNDKELCQLFASSAPEKVVSPTTQLLRHLLHEATSDMSTSNEPPLYLVKLLLEASAVNANQQRFLLLHIIEQQLSVLRNTQGQLCSQDAATVSDIAMQPSICSKLLYQQYVAEPGQSTLPPLIVQWQSNVSILMQRISPFMFDELLAQLDQHALLIPELYRNANRDGFQLSYIFYEFD